MNKLILTCDDYGLTEGVNSAVLQAVKEGKLTSVHILATHATDEAIIQLKEAVSTSDFPCGIGVHFCTTSGTPLTQSENSLVYEENGRLRFYPLTDWSYRRTMDADMFAELEAQYRRITSVFKPTEIDAFSSHNNIHLFSGKYVQMLRQLGNEGHIPLRSPLRWEQDSNPKYPDGSHPAPITEDAIKTGLTTVDHPTTTALLARAQNDRKMKQNRDIAEGSAVPRRVPDVTSGHWYGQPSVQAIRWMVLQLGNRQASQGGFPYASEIFMHLSENDVAPTSPGDEKLIYNMARRVNEHQTLNHNQDIAELLNQIRNSDQIQLGSYRQSLQN